MAKFNIEVELDWTDEETNIDEEIKEQVIDGVKDELLRKATEESVKRLDSAINTCIEKSVETISEKVEQFLSNVCEEKIGSMKIPIKTNSWSSEVKMIPMSEYVGNRYAEFLNKKVLDKDGCTAKYESDRRVSINEYFVDKYLNRELASKVSDMIQKAKKESEEEIVKTLENTLKEQLAVETIKNLNIPQMLEKLQKKAISFNGDQQ